MLNKIPDAFTTLGTDLSLATGHIPKEFQEGLDLFARVQKEYPNTKIVIAGHSLGGAIAEFISSLNPDFTGETFAAPGIAVPPTAQEITKLADVIDVADPVGTYVGTTLGGNVFGANLSITM